MTTERSERGLVTVLTTMVVSGATTRCALVFDRAAPDRFVIRVDGHDWLFDINVADLMPTSIDPNGRSVSSFQIASGFDLIEIETPTKALELFIAGIEAVRAISALTHPEHDAVTLSVCEQRVPRRVTSGWPEGSTSGKPLRVTFEFDPATGRIWVVVGGNRHELEYESTRAAVPDTNDSAFGVKLTVGGTIIEFPAGTLNGFLNDVAAYQTELMMFAADATAITADTLAAEFAALLAAAAPE